MLDFIMNGQPFGSVANALMANDFDINYMRPYSDNKGRGTYVTVVENGKPRSRLISNAPATLRRDDWKLIDEAVIRTAKPRLRAFADLRARGLQMIIPDGMGKTVLEYQTMSDISAATISMDPIRESESDRPEFETGSLPLPVIHKDFYYTARQIRASRNGGSPLDTTTAEMATERVMEEVEKLTLGVAASYSYGGGTVYGYTNFPSRITKTDITDPTNGNWTGSTLLSEVLQMKQASMDAYHYGPWMLYFSPAWDVYLDDDYSATKGDNTLRERLAQINGIEGVRTLDYLTGYQILLVQMSISTARAIVGMDVTTLQWETMGGLRFNFKVMAIMVPQLRADHNGNTGIVHGTTS